MRGFIDQLLGVRTGGILGDQQNVTPSTLVEPARPPAQVPPTIQQTQQQRLSQQPGFANALTRLGLTLLAAQERGLGTGQAGLAGLSAFEEGILAAQQRQQLQAQQQLQSELTQAQLQRTRLASEREEAELGLLPRKQRLAEQEFELSAQKFLNEVATGGIDQKEIFSRGTKLRQEFTNLSKDFIKQRDAFARINASAQDPSAAGDLALRS